MCCTRISALGISGVSQKRFSPAANYVMYSRRLPLSGDNGNCFTSRNHEKSVFRKLQSPYRSNHSKKKSFSLLSTRNFGRDESMENHNVSLMAKIVKAITFYAPIWTTIAAYIGFKYNKVVSPLLGSLPVLQTSLAFLMLAMGLTITPKDVSYALKQPSVLFTNILYCFGMMPLVALGLSKLFNFNSSEAAGIILLGSVSGGQASNLFTLLAGGDVALSVICTFSTTMIGVIATPILIQILLGSSIPINVVEVLQSITKLSLLPLLAGLLSGHFMPKVIERIVPWCPTLGIFATLILVAGGASNTAGSLVVTQISTIIASFLLPLVGGGLALGLSTRSRKISERSRRALVIETLSKSPTLAYVIARKHFDSQSAVVPAAAMVSLAIIGALVASSWSSIRPLSSTIHDSQ